MKAPVFTVIQKTKLPGSQAHMTCTETAPHETTEANARAYFTTNLALLRSKKISGTLTLQRDGVTLEEEKLWEPTTN